MIPSLEEHPEIRQLITIPVDMGRYIHRTHYFFRDDIFNQGLRCEGALYSTATIMPQDETRALEDLMQKHSMSTAHIILDVPNQVRQMTRERIQNTPGLTSLVLDPAYFYNGIIPPQLVYASFNPETLEITLNEKYNPNDPIVLMPKWHDTEDTVNKGTQQTKIDQGDESIPDSIPLSDEDLLLP